jgi:hypothetical protein
MQACSAKGDIAGEIAGVLCPLARAQRATACEACDKLTARCGLLAEKDRGEATLIDELLFDRVVAQEGPQLRSAFRAAIPGQHGITLSLKANQLHYDYVLESAPTETVKSDRRGKGLSLAYSYLSQTSLWAVGYSHEKSFSPGKKTQLCKPLGTTGATTCNEVTIGAPKDQAAEIAFVELRRLFPEAHFAIAPRAEFDAEQSDWAVSVPFYFLRSPADQNALTGGFALGYSSADADDAELTVSIFVSKPFAFFD